MYRFQAGSLKHRNAVCPFTWTGNRAASNNAADPPADVPRRNLGISHQSLSLKIRRRTLRSCSNDQIRLSVLMNLLKQGCAWDSKASRYSDNVPGYLKMGHSWTDDKILQCVTVPKGSLFAVSRFVCYLAILQTRFWWPRPVIAKLVGWVVRAR